MKYKYAKSVPHVSSEVSHLTDSELTHAIIICCQFSPVDDLNSTINACGNVWKLLLGLMTVSGSDLMVPKT